MESRCPDTRALARGIFVLLAALVFTGVGCKSISPGGEMDADERLLGHFLDDYGSRYTISPMQWRHHPGTIYHVEYWDRDGQFLVARNDESNASYPGLWSRIDWILLDDGGEYQWGYCLTVYDAISSTLAAAAEPAVRDMPRTGCNGFPFSRMKWADPPADAPAGPLSEDQRS